MHITLPQPGKVCLRSRELPDHTLVYPCHGAGSLCGKKLSPRNPTTVGFEKHANEMFQLESYDDFRRELLTDMPAPPAYYFATSAKNRAGDGLDGACHQCFSASGVGRARRAFISARDRYSQRMVCRPKNANTPASSSCMNLVV